MIVDKGQPTLLWIRRAHRALAEVLLHGTGRYSNAEFQSQLVGHAFLAPCRILSCHLSDQLPTILGESRSSPRFLFPAPEQPKSYTLPSDKRVRLHIHRCIAPREHSAQVAIIHGVESSARRGFTSRSWKSASCFRRKKFSAARVLWERATRKISSIKSNTVRENVREPYATARKTDEHDVNAQDSTLRPDMLPKHDFDSDEVFAEGR